MKKLLALVMALVMVLAVGSALAGEGPGADESTALIFEDTRRVEWTWSVPPTLTVDELGESTEGDVISINNPFIEYGKEIGVHMEGKEKFAKPLEKTVELTNKNGHIISGTVKVDNWSGWLRYNGRTEGRDAFNDTTAPVVFKVAADQQLDLKFKSNYEGSVNWVCEYTGEYPTIGD